MKDDNQRYTAPPKDRWSYNSEFLVECPKCSKAALVSLESPFSHANGKLVCSNCMHLEKVEDILRYKLIVKRNCDNCGKSFEKIVSDFKEKKDTITFPCPNCGIIRTYEPKVEEYNATYKNSGQASDPIFNLPLWLQADVRGDLFWAYNRSHMNDIKEYVKSKLRERQTMSYTTMVEKLPGFITDSKNRELMLKVIDKLEQK